MNCGVNCDVCCVACGVAPCLGAMRRVLASGLRRPGLLSGLRACVRAECAVAWVQVSAPWGFSLAWVLRLGPWSGLQALGY